jgi:hypothetical protein
MKYSGDGFWSKHSLASLLQNPSQNTLTTWSGLLNALRIGWRALAATDLVVVVFFAV